MKKYFATLLPLFLLIIFLAGDHSSLLRAMPAGSAQPQPAAPLLSVYAFDIGQGDSLLIVSPTGKTVLIDTGNPAYEQLVTGALLSRAGGKSIDLFIASHPHRDCSTDWSGKLITGLSLQDIRSTLLKDEGERKATI